MNDSTAFAGACANLVDACRQLAAMGLSPGSSGNVSLRVDGRILMTPTGSALSRVRQTDLAIVALGSRIEPGPKPSKELPLHLAVYARRTDATAVIHLHSPYATAVSCLPADKNGNAHLPPFTPYRVMRLGEVPLAPYAPPGSSELAAGVEARAGRSAVILLANHGSIVAGSDLTSAIDLVEELEAAAQLTLLLHGLPTVRLSPELVTRLSTKP